MIAKSDLLILVLSASALAAGIYRWQHNLATMPMVTVPASARGDVPARTPTTPVARVVPSDGDASDAESSAVRPTVRRVTPAEQTTVPADTPAEPRVIAAPAPVVEASSDAVPPEPGEPLYGVYRVRSGDNLSLLAQRFGTTVQTLRELNGISGSTILIDQRLRYPQAAN